MLSFHAVIPDTINTLRPKQNEQHFADDIFKRIFFNENVWISIKISLKFVPKGPINNIPALVQIMAWRLSGDKPLSEPMMVSLPTHICARPQWVNWLGALWHVALVVNSWTPWLVPYHLIKPLWFISKSGTHGFHLRVPDLQMSCSDLTWMRWYQNSNHSNKNQVTCFIRRQHVSSSSLVMIWRLFGSKLLFT